ncbi:MAG: transglycosylase SLT domain-containing protein [Planctomycetota bacterium]
MLGLAWLYLVVSFAVQGREHPIVRAVETWREHSGVKHVLEHRALIRKAAAEADVDPYLLAGIMWSESRGVSGRTSSAGALGLMQLSEAAAGDAADRLGLPKPAKDDLLHNDELNVRLAANHLRWLLDHRGEWDTEAVLVSYNAGRSKLKRWAGEHGDYAGWVRSEEQAAEKGEKTTGALAYARRTLRVAGEMRTARSLEGPGGTAP